MKTLLQLIALTIILTGCAATISTFDQPAYTTATSVKVDALHFMDLAVDNYSTHSTDVTDFRTKLEKAYEYEKHRPKNEITLKMWDIIVDSNQHLLGGFIKRWSDSTKLRKAYIEDKKKQVGEAFDKIAELESKKIKKSQAN